MRRISILLIVLVMAATCSAQYFTLSITSPSEGQWQAWISVGQCAGLDTFGIDVYGSDGVTVTGSTLMAPKYYNPDLGDWVGFTEFRSNGTSGMGITAGQKTMYTGGNDPYRDALVIQDVGITAGSGGGVSWDAPALLAEGTYTGSTGYLHVTAFDGYVNALLCTPPRLPWEGPGGIVVAAPFYGDLGPDEPPPPQLDKLYVPEPSSMMAFLALLPFAARRAKNRR